MRRLNQGRQKIGYVYNKQIVSDIAIVQPARNLVDIQEESFQPHSGMTGQGVVRATTSPEENARKIIWNSPTTPAPTTTTPAPTTPAPPRPHSGKGLVPAGGGVCDSRPHPGDELKKKIIKKIIRDNRKKKTLAGSGLVIPTINNKMGSQSMSRTLPQTGNYKIEPKPIVGGFIIASLAAIFSAIAAAATSVVGSVTVGTLAGAALTGAASAAGAKIVKKIGGDGVAATHLVKVVKDTKLKYSDLSKGEREKVSQEYKKYLTTNPSKENLILFAKSIAPLVLKNTKQKLKPKIIKLFKKQGLSGSGLNSKNLGLTGKGTGVNKFKNLFVKNLINQLA